MKHRRIIAIKNPRLRRIRKEFRELWFNVKNSIMKGLEDSLEGMRYNKIDGHRILISERSPENLRSFRSLQERQRDLREDFNRSICVCYICGRIDLDMEYFQSGSALGESAWFCLDCVQIMKRGHANIQAKKASRGYLCESDDDFF